MRGVTRVGPRRHAMFSRIEPTLRESCNCDARAIRVPARFNFT